MTVTIPEPATVGLTDRDAIVGRDEREPDQYTCDLPLHLDMTVHLRGETPILVRLWEHENRAVVRIGMLRACLDLFADADQLDRLINVLTATRARLR